MTYPAGPSTGGPAFAPGSDGQQPVHPTVGNHGQPEGGWRMPAVPQPQQTFQQPPTSAIPQPQQPQQPQQPHPTIPYGQAPQQPQQPQRQPQQPQFPPQPVRAEIPDHVILDGASIPPELRGRTWGQVKQIYGALANDFVLRGAGQPAAQPQQPQGRQPQAPVPIYEQGRPHGGQPPASGTGSFWEDPEGTIDRAIERRLAPVTQRTTAMAIQEARGVARLGVPDFDYLEAEITSILGGANPEALVNPQLWQSTADLARGRLMARGQYDPRAAQQPRQAPQQPNGFARGPGVVVSAQVSPIQPMQYFTEAPTPPQRGFDGFSGGPETQIQNLTQDQLSYAAKMGMSPAEYVAWQGGIQPSTPVRRY